MTIKKYIKTIATIIFLFSSFMLGFTLSMYGIDVFKVGYWLILLIVMTILTSIKLMEKEK